MFSAGGGAGGAGALLSLFGNKTKPGLLSSIGGNPGFDQLLAGLFGHSGAPFKDAFNAYQPYAQQAAGYQMPFYNAGVGATGNLQNMLGKMQDPSGFINNLMGQYKASPYNQYLQAQAQRAGMNAASMGGLSNGMGGAGIGSTPFAEQLQQNAANISQQGMDSWLQNVLGINTQALNGYGGLAGMGQGAANQLSNIFGNMGAQAGASAYGQRYGQEQDRSNIFGGIFHSLFGG